VVAFGSKGGVIGNVSGCGTPKTLIELYKPDGSGQVISTYYFRTEFEIDDHKKIQTLEFSLHADDGIVLYLNGYMIHDGRASIPESAATTNKYYISASAAEQTFTLNYKELRGIIKSGKNILAVELHNNQSGSSDIYFGLDKFGAIVAVDKVEPTFDNVVLGVGADESSRGLSWYSLSSASAEVQYAPVSADKTVFPTEYKSVTAETKKSENKSGYYVNKAVMSGLSENTDYVYRIVSDGQYSSLKYFSTDDSEEFEFVFVGDPQLSSQKHGDIWEDTVDKIISNFDAELLVSAGDQINTPASEDEYGYFIVDDLASIAFAPTIGPPHDDPSIAFSEHFYTPNTSDKYGVTVSGANYWYRYGSALFMHLNMADGTALQSEHKLFIEEAILKNPDASWKIVVLHKALYSTGAHGDPNGKYFESEMSVIRPILAAQFSELGIDIALGGHDHVYVRSHLMNGTELSGDEVYDNKVVNPTGVLHISAGSSTGTKYHDAYSDDVPFAAYQNDERRKSAIHFTVTENSIVMTSYFLDDMSVFDTFTIERKLKADGTIPAKATVNWYDTEGNLIKTNVGYEGFVADIPSDAYVPSGDGYRSVRITKWLDENGNVSDLVIGTDSEYVFIAAVDQPSDGGYIGKISEAMLNLSYYSQFHMNLYLPMIEGMERPNVAGANASYATAFIRNREYWVYTWWMSAVSSTDDKIITVNYTIDGVNYSQRLTIGGLVYAEIALEYSTSQKERLAIANMLRYVRESKIYAGYTVDERFDALIGSLDGAVVGKVTLPDYPTVFAPTDTSLGDLENYISKFYLSIGTSSNFVLVLNQAGIDAGLKNTSFSIYTESGVKINLFDYAGDGKTYQTNNMKVYDAIEKLTITLTLPATDTEPVRKISGTYSLATYITEVEKTGQNVNVAKALYTFGVASADYKKTQIG
ncbi:MAG: metallophosphoesterase family protein, partial [Clostridia bacterium]|nr:metallophosphoesterase family protein [Clostridia bacterium]